MKLKRLTMLALAAALPLSALADTYQIDREGQHAFINFRIQHLGFSWLHGRFNDFSGSFEFDPEKPEAAKVEVEIDPASVDSNHAERDKHLRDEDFLFVSKHPEARFVSTVSALDSLGNGTLTGDLTLRGVTKPVVLQVVGIGAGPDPWGGYRRGFEATTTFALKDFGIEKELGPASKNVELTISVEGIRQ